MPACLPASCASLCTYLPASACLYLLPACLPSCLTVRTHVHLLACLPTNLPTCLPICLLTCLPACLSICLPACRLTCLSANLPLLACLSAYMSSHYYLQNTCINPDEGSMEECDCDGVWWSCFTREGREERERKRMCKGDCWKKIDGYRVEIVRKEWRKSLKGLCWVWALSSLLQLIGQSPPTPLPL